MSVASCDQPDGISAPSILKTTEPSGFVMTLLRRSQTMESNGSTPGVVYRRVTATPPRRGCAEGRLDGRADSSARGAVEREARLPVALSRRGWRDFIEALCG